MSFTQKVGKGAEFGGRCDVCRAVAGQRRAGDSIQLGHKTLRVVGLRDEDADHRRSWP